ncbi:BACON domain-containing protein, partial [Streptococcus danieliae]|nr:BACON domain-containing protein [Streptococcus danieliae]
IRCGADSTRIAVHQSGVIFELSAGSQIMADDKAATYSFDLTCNTELTLNSSEEWISVAVEDGKMNITLKENNTGHIRKG